MIDLNELREQFMNRLQPQDGNECSIVGPQFLSIFGLDCSSPQLIIFGQQINGCAIVPDMPVLNASVWGARYVGITR